MALPIWKIAVATGGGAGVAAEIGIGIGTTTAQNDQTGTAIGTRIAGTAMASVESAITSVESAAVVAVGVVAAISLKKSCRTKKKTCRKSPLGMRLRPMPTNPPHKAESAQKPGTVMAMTKVTGSAAVEVAGVVGVGAVGAARSRIKKALKTPILRILIPRTLIKTEIALSLRMPLPPMRLPIS